ncbi:phage scaffolding protein [Psychrobacillus psychrodurans]|uniref:phage scaffolding protein n=1 Tax=Psychrobacillus psychrodurans TaxID=126157 RepID=UPI001F4D7754|nr:phage scaffolding protein [Psychrobacillus psychrodurans]
MNKEALIALGLTPEQADKVIEGYGTTIPKSRFDDVNNAKKQLETDIASRDKQLVELKKVDAAGLQAQIEKLQGENATAKQEYESKLKDTQLSSAIKLALTGKVHDADIAISQIDKKTIELDAEGKVIKGLDEQLKTLQESKPFLFVPEGKQTIKGVIPATPGKEKEVNAEGDYGKQIAEERSKGNEGLVEAQKTYFD